MELVQQPDGLIGVLLNPDARIDERDDAAMDLAAFPGDRALQALATVTTSSEEPDILQVSAADSIGEIWLQLGRGDLGLVDAMTAEARRAISPIVERNPGLFES
jgi:hypothetical protein